MLTAHARPRAVLPEQYAKDFPQFAKDLLQWHIKTNGDHLVGPRAAGLLLPANQGACPPLSPAYPPAFSMPGAGSSPARSPGLAVNGGVKQVLAEMTSSHCL
jgi:hypothetical protein